MSNHPLKTLPTFKTIELTDSSNTAVLDGTSKLYWSFQITFQNLN